VACSRGQPEIFTLPIFFFRIYVVNSPHLLPAVARNSNTLSSRPFTKEIMRQWANGSDDFLRLHDEDNSFLADFSRAMRTALAPGGQLDYQNLMMAESLQAIISKLDDDVGANGRPAFAFFPWVRRAMGLATSDSVYGRNNPFRNSDIERCFWQVRFWC
jgi:hypothetical protein